MAGMESEFPRWQMQAAARSPPAARRAYNLSMLDSSPRRSSIRRALGLAALGLLAANAAPVEGAAPVDLNAYRPGPVQVVSDAERLTAAWRDESGEKWQAVFSLDPREALIREITAGDQTVLRSARPFLQGETGKRRGGWNAFFDYPPSHPEGTRHAEGRFRLRAAYVRTEGNRVELRFEGLRMGIFDGDLVYTIFPGSRLIQQTARLITNEPDAAYYYDTGIEFAAPDDETAGRNMRTPFAYYDTEGKLRRETANGLRPERVPYQVRYRTLATKAGAGSVAVFPAPHQYFFPRDFTSNLAQLWHRSRRGRVSLGIRQIRDENWIFYPWVNAPPGKTQQMSVFFLLSRGEPESVLDEVLAFTNRDRFRRLEGYRTVSSHWHLAYTVQAMANGFDWTPPFKPVLRDMGVDASIIMDFHGDGHPRDLSDLRLRELDAFFEACRTQSEQDFLLIPSEEANVYLGGHWAVVFPKPVYWFMGRPDGGEFSMRHPKYGNVYSTANAAELLDMVKREGGWIYQTHARTKGSTGYPDRILESEHFRDESYFGAGWKAMPSDLSSPRLGDRVFTLLDDLSHWGFRKRVLGEVDVFQFDHTDELYAHMNVNYARADRLPDFDHYDEILKPLVDGEFFVTTGEVLLPEVTIGGGADAIDVSASLQWTFPLAFAEVIWGDGKQVHRQKLPLTRTAAFGSEEFKWEVAAPRWKWARLAVWDVAANGAFVNPVWR